MADKEENRRVFKALDEMKADVEAYTLEIIRARGHGDAKDPFGRPLSYETMAALILSAAAASMAARSDEPEFLKSVFRMKP